MSTSDPIGDFIIQLKNAGMAGRASVSVPYSKHKHAIAEKLQQHGFLSSVEKYGRKARKTLSVELQTANGAPVVQDVKRVSKPSRRIYEQVGDLGRYRGGRATLFLSTPHGILTAAEAVRARVGGEALFAIYR